MSSFDERDSSDTKGLQLPGLVTQLSPAEQVSFPQGTPLPSRRTRLLDYTSDTRVSAPLPVPVADKTSSLPDQCTCPGVAPVFHSIHTCTFSALPSTSSTQSLRL